MDDGNRDEGQNDDGWARGNQDREFLINSARERRLLHEILSEREREESRAEERRSDCRTLRISITSAVIVLVCSFLLTGSSAPWWLPWVMRLLHLG